MCIFPLGSERESRNWRAKVFFLHVLFCTRGSRSLQAHAHSVKTANKPLTQFCTTEPKAAINRSTPLRCSTTLTACVLLVSSPSSAPPPYSTLLPPFPSPPRPQCPLCFLFLLLHLILLLFLQPPSHSL